MALPPTPRLQDRRPPGPHSRFVDVELVRVDGALHDALAEAVGGGDEHGVVEAGFGVHGEHDTGGGEVGADHALHSGGQRDGFVFERVVDAVGDGPVVVQGREDLLDGQQDLLDPADVEERFLLPGERCVRQVFGGGAGPYGEGTFGLAAGESLVGRSDVGFQIGGERLRHHRRAEPFPDGSQFLNVVGVQPVQSGLDDLREARLVQEPPIGVRGGGEPVRHRDPGGRQLADHFTE